MNFDQLPALNATLNAICTVLLVRGYSLIRAKKIEQHRTVMVSAFVVSIVFLACYLLHKWHLYNTTGAYNTTIAGQGAWRIVYLGILISHVTLAATVPVLALITINRGLNMRVELHRKIAKITFPIWLYVSVTGVIVYFMLYQWFPSAV
jgi:protein SCO1/2/putative membrane protein